MGLTLAVQESRAFGVLPSRVSISEQTLEFSARFALATCDWARAKGHHSKL